MDDDARTRSTALCNRWIDWCTVARDDKKKKKKCRSTNERRWPARGQKKKKKGQRKGVQRWGQALFVSLGGVRVCGCSLPIRACPARLCRAGCAPVWLRRPPSPHRALAVAGYAFIVHGSCMTRQARVHVSSLPLPVRACPSRRGHHSDAASPAGRTWPDRSWCRPRKVWQKVDFYYKRKILINGWQILLTTSHEQQYLFVVQSTIS